VVRAAQAEDLIDLRKVPFDEDEAWASITRVHGPAYVNGGAQRPAGGAGQKPGLQVVPAIRQLGRAHLGRAPRRVPPRAHGADGAAPCLGRPPRQLRQRIGFCTFNFLVGGAVELLRMGLHRVAIIDLDAHPGDGTYRLSRGREGIALFDIAGGSWVDVVNTSSVEYHVARDASQYEVAFRRLEAFLDRVRPELVMFQAGMDPYEHDPVGGILGVDETFLGRRDAHVIAEVSWRRIPLVVNNRRRVRGRRRAPAPAHRPGDGIVLGFVICPENDDRPELEQSDPAAISPISSSWT